MGCFRRCKRCLLCCSCGVAVLAVALGALLRRLDELTCLRATPQRNLDLPQRCLAPRAEVPPPAAEAPARGPRRKYTITVYGATGLTGKFGAEYLAGRAARYGVTWAISGRSYEKLLALQRHLGQGGWWGSPSLVSTGPSVPDVLPVDAGDLQGLRRIAAQSDVVVSFAGPYAQFGSPLVEACAREGSHYVDITGDYYWVRRMVEQFGDIARSTGACLVFTAGYDSAPFDLMAMMVADAVARAGDEPTEVRSVVLRTVGLMSWGSLKSGIGMAFESLTGMASKDATCDPYLHLRGTGFEAGCEVDRAVNPVGQLPWTPDEAFFGRELGPTKGSVMGEINARNVRYSLHVLGYRNVSYSEMELEGASLIGDLVANGTLRQEDTMPKNTLPEAVSRDGFFEVEMVARGLHGKVASLRLESTHGDPGYNWTAAIAMESGLCLADPECRKPDARGGFHTCVSAMGMNLAKRAQAVGILRWIGLPID